MQTTFRIFKMAAVPMEMAKMQKKWKTQNYHSRLLAEQKLMKLVRNNMHIWWNEISQKKYEIVWTTLRQLPWKQKRVITFFLDSFHQTSWNFVGISIVVCGSVWGCWKKFKMAMVTKVQKILNSNHTADPFKTWHRNRSSLKVMLFVLKNFKMATISKWSPI